MPTDPFAPLADGSNPVPGRSDPPRRRCLAPVPPRSPRPPARHPKLGKPSTRWTYNDQDGGVLGYVCRFEEEGGGKSFRPLVLFEGGAGKPEWRWESWPVPRPLYHLAQLVARPDAAVILTEGEKSADAIEHLAPTYIGMTSPGGSKGAAKADWGPLVGRDVIIWPDADEPGAKYAEDVVQLLREAGARSISRISPPDSVPKGFDAENARLEGWTEDRVEQLMSEAAAHATEAGIEPEAGGKGGGDRKPRQRDLLLSAADGVELWHDPQKRSYATIPVSGHLENWPLESEAFRRWLAGRYYENTASAPGTQQLADALRVLDVNAVNDGPEYRPYMRTGTGKDAIWLDLADEEWRAVKITSDGWKIEQRPPVKFIRTEIMTPLPDPEAGYLLEELRAFINADDDDYVLTVAWMIAAMWGRGTSFPVLALGGEQGSGKSTVSMLLRSLVDPSEVEIAAPPRDERDLIVAAGASHILAFDNVSRIENWFSDAICRMSTGSGFLTRKLHTDSDAAWFKGSRPVILNGIPSLTDRADLAERALTVRLKRIDEDGRQSEDDFWLAWEVVRPRVLGALLDALAGAMRRYDDIKLTRMPRMAAFAKLMAAAGPGLGWEDEFDIAYSHNRANTTETAFEADPVAVAAREWMIGRVGATWEGTATDLLAELNKTVSEDIRKSRFWPSKVNALGNAVDRAAPLLRQKGINVSKKTTSSARVISITMAGGE